MFRSIGNKLRHQIAVAIDWRVRDVLEAERRATVELGKTFIEGTAMLRDQQALLEQRIVELEKKIHSLDKGS
jgi:hypothetical protein